MSDNIRKKRQNQFSTQIDLKSINLQFIKTSLQTNKMISTQNFLFTKQIAKQLISHLTNNKEQFSLMVDHLLKNNSPCAIIFMQHYEIMPKYSQILQSYTSSHQIPQSFLHLYCYVWKFFPSLITYYFKGKNTRNIPQKTINKLTKQIKEEMFQPCQPLNKIVKEYFQLIQMRNQYEKIPKLQEFTQKILKINDEKNQTFQYCLNYMKKCTQDMQKDPNINLCCRYYYTLNSPIQCTESNVQEFKKYYFPIQNDNIKYHLKKTIVAFLNRKGGIIYIGLQEKKTKCVYVSGIHLQSSKKLQFKKFMKEQIINSIYPKFDYEKEDEQIAYINRLAKVEYLLNRVQYFFNKYISMDFIPIVDEDTLLNRKDLYLVRIKVKPGDPNHFYHLLSTTYPISPEFFIRQDKTVKKKTFLEAMPQMQARLYTKETPQYRPYHQQCTFSLQPHDYSKQYAQIKKSSKRIEQKIRSNLQKLKNSKDLQQKQDLLKNTGY